MSVLSWRYTCQLCPQRRLGRLGMRWKVGQHRQFSGRLAQDDTGGFAIGVGRTRLHEPHQIGTLVRLDLERRPHVRYWSTAAVVDTQYNEGLGIPIGDKGARQHFQCRCLCAWSFIELKCWARCTRHQCEHTRCRDSPQAYCARPWWQRPHREPA